MRRTTIDKVYDLLHEVAGNLRQYGRPRKRPGKDRPEAMTRWGSVVKPTHPNAAHFSLGGTFKASAKNLGYSRRVMRHAMVAFATEAIRGTNWTVDPKSVERLIKRLDNDTADTRALVRTARTAARKVGV